SGCEPDGRLVHEPVPSSVGGEERKGNRGVDEVGERGFEESAEPRNRIWGVEIQRRGREGEGWSEGPAGADQLQLSGSNGWGGQHQKKTSDSKGRRREPLWRQGGQRSPNRDKCLCGEGKTTTRLGLQRGNTRERDDRESSGEVHRGT